MKISVVVCMYPMERYGQFSECVEPVLDQQYDPLEVILVVDGNEKVYEHVQSDFDCEEDVVVHYNDENRGISFSQTKGELASGKIVAFIDDDVTAEDVRNTYRSNISYRREALLSGGGNNPNERRRGAKHLQAHGAPAGIRLLKDYGKGIVFTEDTVVHHKLFEYRGESPWLVFWSFWQGYSKRIIYLSHPDVPVDKSEYLKQLLIYFVPNRFGNLIRPLSVAGLKQFVSIFVSIRAVGLGYLYALLTPNVVEGANS